MCKHGVFNIQMFFHGHNAICFEISNKTFLASWVLNKDNQIDYLIVTNYAPHNLSIDEVYRFPIIHAKNAYKGGGIQMFPKLHFGM